MMVTDHLLGKSSQHYHIPSNKDIIVFKESRKRDIHLVDFMFKNRGNYGTGNTDLYYHILEKLKYSHSRCESELTKLV